MQELYPTKVKKCYACIQWDGNRTYYAAKQQIKTDQGSSGNCRVIHQPRKGRDCCDNYFPLQ